MQARIYLDVSRLLSAGWRATPSGIERVELAYAKQFGAVAGTRFVACCMRKLLVLPDRFAVRYVAALEHGWTQSGRACRLKTLAKMVAVRAVLCGVFLRSFLPARPQRDAGNPVYLNLSHQNLDAPRMLSRFAARRGAKSLFFVHDLIPITHPEYARPGQAELHRRRMDTVAALADAVLVNSAATRADFLSHVGDRRPLPVHVAHLGIAGAAAAIGPAPDGMPYFLFLATIEPRKNHLLLLNLWRSLAEEMAAVPRLIIAGRRGWESEMVLDMLERCAAIAGIVEERQGLGDTELRRLMRGARALVLPSFAEGFGLPVAEALAAGTPVICTDLPALREIAGDVPDYIGPLDGAGWRLAILDYAQPGSPRRAAQCERLRSWEAPSWDQHFRVVHGIIDALSVPAPAAGLRPSQSFTVSSALSSARTASVRSDAAVNQESI